MSRGLLPSLGRQVVHQPRQGLASGRGSSLPPDGLLCNYSPHLCHGQRLQGYEFCIRHILEDKSAPYKPCAYTVETGGGQGCPRAAPRTSRGEGYCREHSRAVVSARSRLAKKRGGGANQALQESLGHYKKGRIGEGGGECRLGQIVLAGERAEESEDEGVRVGDTWAGDGESEGESVDSEGEESLKHAGVFTGEEVMRTMRDKLIRLQKLYIEQFGRLGHQLREGRRGYLAQVREEREAGLMNISSQPKDNTQYSKMKALTHYHAPAGREALLAARLREKRAVASGGKGSTAPPSPCQHHLTSTTKCGEGVVPMARYCPKHILEQQGQVLYRQCGAITDKDDGPCEVPVPGIFSHSTCVFHVKMLPRVVGDVTQSSVRNAAEVTDAFCNIGDETKNIINGQAEFNDMDVDVVKDEVVDSKDEIALYATHTSNEIPNDNLPATEVKSEPICPKSPPPQSPTTENPSPPEQPRTVTSGGSVLGQGTIVTDTTVQGTIGQVPPVFCSPPVPVTDQPDAPRPADPPGPATVQSDTPGPATVQSDTPGPATDQSGTPGPATDQSDIPGPATDQSNLPGPATDQSDTPGPATDQSDTPGTVKSAAPGP